MKKSVGIILMFLIFYVVKVSALEYDVLSQTFNRYNYDKTQVRYLQKELRVVMGCEIPTSGNFNSQTISCLNKFKRYYNLTVDESASVNNTVISYLNYQYLMNKVIISSTKANVRLTPKVQSGNIIGSYKKGDIIKVYGTTYSNGYTWYKVKYNNISAYVASSTLKTDFVEIDIISQTLRLYKNSKLILDTPVTTGKADGKHDTNTGYFNVVLKQKERYLQPSNSYVRYWVRFYWSRALGIHDADWRTEYIDYTYFGGTVYQNPTPPAGNKKTGSHGCVNVPVPKMKTIYDNVVAETTSNAGTAVYVHK